MLKVSDRDFKIIKSILSKYPYSFFAFGSRIKGKEKKYSDLDICYKDTIPDSIITKIYGEFEDSSLPFKIELLSWARCDNEFKKSIENDLTLI